MVVVNEIEFEGAERTAVAELLQARVVRDAGFLEFTALGGVDTEAGDALEFAARAYFLETGAEQPNVVATPMLHPKFDRDAAHAGGVFLADEIRRGFRIFRVDARQPGVVC